MSSDNVQGDAIPAPPNVIDRLPVSSQTPQNAAELGAPFARTGACTFSLNKTSDVRQTPLPRRAPFLEQQTGLLRPARPCRAAVGRNAAARRRGPVAAALIHIAAAEGLRKFYRPCRGVGRLLRSGPFDALGRDAAVRGVVDIVKRRNGRRLDGLAVRTSRQKATRLLSSPSHIA